MQMKPTFCFPCVHNSLANVYFEMVNIQMQNKNLKKPFNFDSNFVHAYNGLGTVYRITQRFPEAEINFKSHSTGFKLYYCL